MSWKVVEERIGQARAITWDTCHKIYVLLDDEQVKLMNQYGYDPIITDKEATPEQMLDYLKEWFNESCSLRFIQAVRTDLSDPNDGFENLISQGEDEEEDEEEV